MAFDLRSLRSFCAVVEEGSISKAAQRLHLSQPSLSRQIQELEYDVGCQLLVRGSRFCTLTPQGCRFLRRAQELIGLAERTLREMKTPCQGLHDDLSIGAGESVVMEKIGEALQLLRQEGWDGMVHIHSGIGSDLREHILEGVYDFGLFIGEQPLDDFQFFRLPVSDRWMVVVPSGHPLAQKTLCTPEDLSGQPLIVSAQALSHRELAGWFGESAPSITATYSLFFNGSQLVKAGLGVALSLEGLCPDPALCWIELDPPLYASLYLVWKKGKPLSPSARRFLDLLKTGVFEADGSAG